MENSLLLTATAARILDSFSEEDRAKGLHGHPFIAKSVIEKRASSVLARGEALLDVVKSYFLWPSFRTENFGAAAGFELTPWGDAPNEEFLNPSPLVKEFAKVIVTTTDSHTAMRLCGKRDSGTLYDLVLHPYIQRVWYEHIKEAEASPHTNQNLDPSVKHLLTKDGQTMWFIQLAQNDTIDAATRIKAMVNAGKMRGFYSEKIQLMHENAPQITQNVQNNYMVGTDLANKFRLFLMDKLQLEVPTDNEPVEEAEVVEIPPFLQL